MDSRIVNGSSAAPTERLHLPSLEQLGGTTSLMRRMNIHLFFTKLDISNMFYTCRPLPEATGGIRVQIGNTVYGFPGLPVAWAHSPSLAEE